MPGADAQPPHALPGAVAPVLSLLYLVAAAATVVRAEAPAATATSRCSAAGRAARRRWPGPVTPAGSCPPGQASLGVSLRLPERGREVDVGAEVAPWPWVGPRGSRRDEEESAATPRLPSALEAECMEAEDPPAARPQPPWPPRDHQTLGRAGWPGWLMPLSADKPARMGIPLPKPRFPPAQPALPQAGRLRSIQVLLPLPAQGACAIGLSSKTFTFREAQPSPGPHFLPLSPHSCVLHCPATPQ